MNIKTQTTLKGFTLIEMLLVLVIASMLIYMGLTYLQESTLASRQDKTSLQMQQILNAALSYYVVNGNWPTSLACLQGGEKPCAKYLPETINSPWPQTAKETYVITSTANPPLLYVSLPITAATGSTSGSAMASANVIAGQLPLAYTSSSKGSATKPPDEKEPCTKTSNKCYVVASVNAPGQNLNNAPSVNFAGVYHHGGCIPVPSCPIDASGNAMTAEVFVVPLSVSGVSVQTPTGGATPVVYPINSFTAYAIGGADGHGSSSPGPCTEGLPADPPCGTLVNGAPTSGKYWRACLQVITTQGDVAGNTDVSYQWGKSVSLGAFTRCAITNESSGSDYTTVYSH